MVSKRIDKRAVVRNRIKRTVRGFVEKHLDSIKKGYDVLVIIKKNFGEKEKKEVLESVASGLQKQGLIT